MVKKTTTKETEEVKVVGETPIINSDFAKLLEIYKVQNPIKYELKKAELLNKLNK